MFLAARTLRLASIAACLITIASFAVFAVDQTGSASAHQQSVLNGGTPVNSPEQSTTGQSTAAAENLRQPGSNASTAHESTARKVIDEASNALTSPFSGVTAGWTSQWSIRGAKLLLALALYGFVLGFIARFARVRV
jgi:hypothetical protein